MKRNAFLPLAAIVLIGALSIGNQEARAALPCPDCQAIFQKCLDAGGSYSSCEASQPGYCYGCPPPLSDNTKKVHAPDFTKHHSAFLAWISRQIHTLKKLA
ncbi:hypothetical protein [Oleiagrimonas soli]|uniref:Lipoprotein n=1 Tax=Oleiagrimonas soli TaxID=1543381 RepID=A0A841KD87_9GAMM|nr:hypothetical protein [Oleiagrimonas soli]MBB6182875.1 hypothetical protein [Oleiagrimonas soli]